MMLPLSFAEENVNSLSVLRRFSIVFYIILGVSFQIETEDDGNEDSGDSELESDEDLDLSKITEMRLVPSDPTQCTFIV